MLAATRYPAEFSTLIGAGAGDFGTIETGKRADLLLLEANPLTEIHNTTRIAGVMASGRWIPRQQIDSLLGRIEKRIQEQP